MGKQAKPKNGQSRNDSRPNGKAFKQNAGKKGGTGSKSSRMDEGFLILLGKGKLYTEMARIDAEGRREMLSKKNRAKKSDSSDDE